MPEIRMPIGGTTPPAPAVNEVSLYAKADKRFYMQDDTGAEVKILTDEATLAGLNVQLPLTSTGGSTPTVAINNVTTLANGAMLYQDKVKLDGSTALNTVNTLVQRDALGNFSANEITATAFNGPATTVTTIPALTGDITSTGLSNATTIAASAIDDSKISPTAAISLSKLAVDPLNRANHSGVQDATSTLTNLGTAIDSHLTTNSPIVDGMIDATANIALSKLATDPLARANHTGTQTVATISDFTTEVNSTIATYRTTNPIVNADISAIAAIDLSKLATNPLDRANHTGTQLSATISDFTTTAQGVFTGGNGIDITTGTISVDGTANRIDVSGGTVDIASTYVGQTSINTLGTVIIGTWNGSTVGLAYGGTGATSAGTAANNLVAVDVISTSDTLSSSNGVVLVDASASLLTITLPSAANVFKFTIKKIDATVNNVVINVDPGDTIEGSTSISLTAQYQYITIVSDGTTTWYEIAKT